MTLSKWNGKETHRRENISNHIYDQEIVLVKDFKLTSTQGRYTSGQ